MKIKSLVFCLVAAALLASCFGRLQAQAQTSGNINQDSEAFHQSFTQKIDMGNVYNKESIYFLLLCKSIPNANSKMSGTLTIETDSKDICDIEVNVFLTTSPDNNTMDISNLCNIVTRIAAV